MSFPSIIEKLLKHQAELATTLAEPQHIDLGRRKQLRDEILSNKATFERFVAHYKIPVARRKGIPAPAGTCPNCLR